LDVAEHPAFWVFEEHAEEYDDWYRRTPGRLIFEMEAKALAELIPSGIGVEVGVGTGVFAARLGVPFGVDPALRPLKIAVGRGVDAIRAVAEALPIRDESLDYVLLTVTICYLDRPAEALREIHRVLRHGGSIVLGFVPRDSPWGKVYVQRKRAGRRFYKEAYFYTLDEVKQLLKKAGFKTEEILGTLAQKPNQVQKIEEPTHEITQKGFLCIKAVKT